MRATADVDHVCAIGESRQRRAIENAGGFRSESDDRDQYVETFEELIEFVFAREAAHAGDRLALASETPHGKVEARERACNLAPDDADSEHADVDVAWRARRYRVPAALALLTRVHVQALRKAQHRRKNVTNHLRRHPGI